MSWKSEYHSNNGTASIVLPLVPGDKISVHSTNTITQAQIHQANFTGYRL